MAARHTLFGSRDSGAAAVEMALQRCGLAYDLVRASSWEPDSAGDALGRVNPLRQIPTLVLPDGTVLTESAAILVHLGLSRPSSGLLPRTASARARALRGLVYIAANCYAAIGIGDYPERWTNDKSKEARAAVRAGARRQLHRHWVLFADTFHPEPHTTAFLTGDAPGALDMLAVVVSKWSGTRTHLARHRPAFAQLLARIEQHEGIAPVWRNHWPG